jgi:PhnB protein
MTTTRDSTAPYLHATDAPATIAFLEKLGFTLDYAIKDPSGRVAHAELSRGPLHFMVGQVPGPVVTGKGMEAPLSLYVTLQESVDALHERATRAGITVEHPLTDQFWGDRTFSVLTPDGVSIMFAQNVRAVSPEELERAMAQAAPASA